MKIVRGDLIELALGGTFDVIIHGCNCQCAMGAGIAKGIRAKFREAYEADRATVKGDGSKLGTITYAELERGGHRIVVVNAYTQYHWRGNGVLVDYGAVRSAMAVVKSKFSGSRIGYPLIGAGLAGGDWNQISDIINEELVGENHTLVEYAA